MTREFEFSEIESFHNKVSRVIDINFFISDFCNKFLEMNPEYTEVVINENGERKYRFYSRMKVVWNKNKEDEGN